MISAGKTEWLSKINGSESNSKYLDSQLATGAFMYLSARENKVFIWDRLILEMPLLLIPLCSQVNANSLQHFPHLFITAVIHSDGINAVELILY